ESTASFFALRTAREEGVHVIAKRRGLSMRRLGITLVALALVGSAAAGPTPAPFPGIVVGVQKGTLLVTSSSGAVRAIPGDLRIGARVAVAGGKLIVLGRAHRA